MEKILKEKLQQEIQKWIRLSYNIENLKSIKFVIDESKNQIIRIKSNKEGKELVEKITVDEDGYTIQIDNILYVLDKKYGYVNDSKKVLLEIYKYKRTKQILERAYKYEKDSLNVYMNGKLSQTSKYKDNKIIETVLLNSDNGLNKYTYEYKDGFKIIKKNGKISSKERKDSLFIYDENGNMEKEINYKYDDRDRLIKFKTSKGVCISFKYDENNRLIKVNTENRELDIQYNKDYTEALVEF